MGCGGLIATDNRLIVANETFSLKLKIKEFPYNKISFVQFSTGTWRGERNITIHAYDGKKEVFNAASNDEAIGFTAHLREKIHSNITTSVPDDYKTAKVYAINNAIRGLDNFDLAPVHRGEIKQLPDILGENELPEKMMCVIYDGWDGMLFATPSRLIFVPSGGKRSLRIEAFPYDAITSVESSTGIVFGKMTIYSSGMEATFETIVDQEFEEYLRAKIPASAPSPATSDYAPAPPMMGTVSVADELEKLHNLVDKGILMQEEFEVLKKKLIQI